MELKKTKYDIIQRLKKVRIEQGLSVAMVQKKLEDNGYYISEATLKRLFYGKSTNFRYQYTLLPLAEVLEVKPDTPDVNTIDFLTEENRRKQSAIDELQAIIRHKDDVKPSLMFWLLLSQG